MIEEAWEHYLRAYCTIDDYWIIHKAIEKKWYKVVDIYPIEDLLTCKLYQTYGKEYDLMIRYVYDTFTHQRQQLINREWERDGKDVKRKDKTRAILKGKKSVTRYAY